MPTRKRLENVLRFIAQYDKTHASEPVLLLVDEDDDTYDNIPYHPHFFLQKMKKGDGITSLMNQAFHLYPDEPYYALIADDVIPETDHWDKLLVEECLRCGGVAWADDCWYGPDLAAHPFLNGDMVRSYGYIAHPILNHCGVDNLWMGSAYVLGNGYRADIKMPHLHHGNGKAQMDETYERQPQRVRDNELFLMIRDSYMRQSEDMKRERERKNAI